ncbi:ribonuclease Y, partial [Desulfuromonas sp. TF]|uniref:ribonuclease Y n=1 Tax=Desulfuromonas sp. TF TaxID=1232410 RepID=UPI00048872FB
LERLSGLSSEEAKEQLIRTMESEARHDAAKRIKQIEDEAKETADKKAKEILALAIQRYAGDYVAEKTVSVVPLPTDEMKGRIIGREGRNIRAIEAATGIDLIIDDTPEAVIISGFNPVRREVARLALERLITDGRIHPARIEEVVNKAALEVDEAIREAGEQATFDVGVHGINPEIIKLIGRLKYRTSYGQNVLQHSLEVAFLCGIMAAELGLNVKQAKRAGLLHDIGKAVDHEIEGSHAVIGADLARKYGESPKIVHALAAHHEDEKPETMLAVLVQAADALSGARPGARREMLETYVKRLQDLERIGTSFGGVTSCFAIQAGREIRVMVSSEDVSDAHSHVLARDIARKIEDEMTYPGQIKVNVIRETRAIEYAK